ncbi:FliM/FliN family flagellar motor switch protein [Proteus hauseri]|uniref:FliM/FliN family flagellar motor switch protein n=1 Tax=Proteus hauseri TaxID=183417 RepID=UPI0010097724|nr:FliM/FliN family flagellar motor switch protein [Proteus hauseri]QAV22732.1 type III secretion protein [Proteus hauseri]
MTDEFDLKKTESNNKVNNTMKILSSLFTPQEIKVSERYFLIKGESFSGSFTGLVSVNQAMDIAYPKKNINWTQIPFSYLQSLLSMLFSQILFPFSKEPMTLIIDNIWVNEQKKILYPVVSTEIGDIFISDIKGKYEWISLSEKRIGSIAKFNFGYSKISISLLRTLSIGDIFLIDNVSLLLLIGEKKWMSFKWEGEDVVELNKLSDDLEKEEKTNIEEVSQEKKDLKPIGTIPVTVSFLLASKVLLIEQIESLVVGQQISLPENASRHITLAVNGTPIAQGELIQVGERFAVEIQHSYPSYEQTYG